MKMIATIAYSGSAYQIGDKLFIFYTGSVRDENWIRDPSNRRLDG